jgi:Tol biopolymer transport system component
VNPGGGSSNAVTFTIASAAIVFSASRAFDGSDNAMNSFNIWVMNPDGSGAKPLSQLTATGTDSVNAIWSPDGSKILFDSLRALDGSDAGNNPNPNSSPTDNIWVMNADGSGAQPLTRLTAVAAFSQGAVWSPDGSKIAYHSQRALDGSNNGTFGGPFNSGTLNIWVMNADGSGATPLTKNTSKGVATFSPEWRP